VTIAGLTATNQNVISLTEAQGFANSASDGLMGMAFESIANSKSSPYFFTLVNEGKVSPTEFSFYVSCFENSVTRSRSISEADCAIAGACEVGHR
jgi:hypothetical protein